MHLYYNCNTVLHFLLPIRSYDAAPSKVVCEPLFGKPTSNLPFLLVRVKGMVSHVLRQGVDSI